ncbi:hypothetical protein PCANC_04620 [Puccinia coronata f. sp. avenae]|uniref:DH domain-containing protein n=1 Tax=Puccinia coronata f. sp. avenae TaxID=200324 RepID=A0A2N5W0G0_9BASI|nr:hypothetical protein PCANC_04620 [Puccinia coronata f. sp. avenae]
MWVTLEQTTGLQRRASIATSSIHRDPRQQGPTSFPLESETLSLPYKHRETTYLSSHSPRARFAENPVIGPTREASTRLSRRKSALKTRSPSQIISPPSQTPTVNVVTPHETSCFLDKPGSSSTGSILLLPSASSKRHRATSMIASDNNPRLDPRDARNLSRPRKKSQDKDQFSYRQRAHSVSDLTPPDVLPQHGTELESYPLNRITAMSSNTTCIAGYVTDQNTLFPDRPRRNLSYLSSPGEEDDVLSLSNYESLDLSDHSNSRPVSNISSSATSSFSSTLTPPPVRNSADVDTYRAEKMTPEISQNLEDFLPASAPSASSFIHQHYYSGESGNQVDPDHIISPLERIASLTAVRPSINRRKRSGTVLPPKKPELVFEASPNDSCIVLPIDSLLSKIGEHEIKPPARPPRSNRRGAPPQIPAPSPTTSESKPASHMAEIKPREPTHSDTLKTHLISSTAATPLDLVYDSAKSSPASLPDSVPVANQQPKPTIRIFSETEKHLPERRISLKPPHSESHVRSPTPPSAPRRNAAKSASYAKTSAAPIKQRHRSQSASSPLVNSGTEDEGDDFESAEEGDDQFWSVAGSSHEDERSSTADKQTPASSTNDEPPECPAHLQSLPPDKSSEAVVSEKPVNSYQKNKKSGRVTMIGAFPHSESYAESFISTSHNNEETRQELSIEEVDDPLFNTYPPSAPQKLAESYRERPQQRASTPEATHQLYTPRRISHLSPIKPDLSQPPSIRTPLPERSFNRKQGSPVSPYPASRVAITPKSPFDDFRISRASSLEGLAALRNPNSVSPQSPRKKTSVRSVPLLQLSKILSFCANDHGFEESSSDGHAQPVPPEVADRQQAKPIISQHSPSPVQAIQPSPHVPSTWKNTMPKNAYDNLLNMYGAMEMQRQELIWELCETENSFAMGLRQVIEIFAFPLRTPEGAWISGVPTPVARLLDWLEDIVNLHSQMAFQAKNCCQYQTQALGLVVHISEVYLELTPKLELYQPYLVRFREVTAAIEEMVADVESDFGEFVRMQSSLPECGRMSMTSFLLKPIQRLMKYPLFYKQLCDLTPPEHPDHDATICLLDATDSVIRVLQEVKEREEEYEKLKVIESRMKGLPKGFKLAIRDRRLLAQGLLKRVQLTSRDASHRFTAGAQSNNHTWTLNAQPKAKHIPQSHVESSPQFGNSSEYMTSSTSRNSYQSNWSQHSYTSSSSASTESTNSHRSSYANRENEQPLNFSNYPSSPVNPFPPGSQQFYEWMALSNKPVNGKREEKHYLRTRSSLLPWESQPEDHRYRGKKSLNTSRILRKPKESPVHVFVFSDVILLATRHSDGVRLIRSSKLQKKRKDSSSPSYYSVLEDVGVSRLLSVSDISGELDYPHLLKVDLVPFGGDEDDNTTLKQTQRNRDSSQAVLLSFPDRHSSGTPNSTTTNSTHDSIRKEKHRWISAFLQGLTCIQEQKLLKTDSTISANTSHIDYSPSEFSMINSYSQEREERTWWSVRHKLVSKELEVLRYNNNNNNLNHSQEINYIPNQILPIVPSSDSSNSSSSNSSSSNSYSHDTKSKLHFHSNRNPRPDHNPFYLHHPEHRSLIDEIKTSGLGLDLNF